MDVGPSFAKHMLEDGHSYGLTELEMAFLVGGFFGAGSNTVSPGVVPYCFRRQCD